MRDLCVLSRNVYGQLCSSKCEFHGGHICNTSPLCTPPLLHSSVWHIPPPLVLSLLERMLTWQQR